MFFAKRLILAWIIMFVVVGAFVANALEARKPNVIVILVDDLGYADLGCQGSTDVKTPHIDSLAASGVRFTDGYVTAPQCGPSRAGLLTGRYQNRFGFESNEQAYRPGIPLDQPLISERMKAAGYVTGMFGKWGVTNYHEGHPPQRGFDESFWNHDGNRYFPETPSRYDIQMRRGNQAVELKEYSTDAFGREAVAFIHRHARKPFFIYLPVITPHEPNEAKPEDLKRFTHVKDKGRRTFLAMMACLDDNIGRILDALREKKLEDDTLIFFLSDNGGYPGISSRNDPFWGTKSSMAEGGIRIPFIVQWKGHLPAGKVYKKPVISLDILPTSLSAAGVKIDSSWKLDGVDLLPYLSGRKDGTPHEALYWRFNFPQAKPERHGWAIRKGDWKLMRRSSNNKPFPAALYNLKDDPREGMIPENDVITAYPKVAQELRAEWEEWNRGNQEPAQYDWKKPAKGAKGAISSSAKPLNGSRPNIVFMFADDLGYRDLACYGHPYAKTPALDRLASEGTRFTQAYAAGQTCSPSRTGIMTGLGWPRFPRSPARFGFGDRVTVTELLNKAGYATGHFGKWHIGPIEERAAGVYGVDEYDRCGPRDIHKLVPPEGRDAPIYEKAVEFIKKNKDRPFYVNVWGFSTHWPVQSHPKHLAEFKETKINPDDFSEYMRVRFRDCIEVGGDLDVSMRHYLANVYALDRNVASLLKAIDDLGLRDNTVVVFSSDQGPAVVRLNDGRHGKAYTHKEGDENMLGDAGPFRGTKHTVLEGGLRIPFIIRWPGKVKAGRVDDTNVIGGVDWLPSICKLAGVEAPQDIDGEDVSDMWLGAQRERQKPLFWRGYEGLTVRDGKWRYYRGRQGDELYDLRNDPGEARNLATSYPEVTAKLRGKTLAWQEELPKPPPISALFNFDHGFNDGSFLTRNNETRISEPEIRDGVFNVRLSPGLVHPTPLLFRDRPKAITAFSSLRIRMRVTVEDGSGCGPARALLRDDGWKGKDIPFNVHADGQWHEYVIDVTQSPAWSQWTERGRIGMVMPEPDQSPIAVEIDFIKLE